MASPVDLVLVRAGLLPDLALKPGAVLHARVLDARTVLLEGARLAAQLPEGVQAGQVLRVRVQEAGAERLHLKIVEQPRPGDQAAAPVAPQVPPDAGALLLPGGVQARIWVDGRETGGRGRRGAATSVVVRYDSPTLGRLDVRLDADRAAVHVPAGEPAQRVRDAAGALAEALGRLVTVHPRTGTVDRSA